jgi:hypothetical protein
VYLDNIVAIVTTIFVECREKHTLTMLLTHTAQNGVMDYFFSASNRASRSSKGACSVGTFGFSVTGLEVLSTGNGADGGVATAGMTLSIMSKPFSSSVPIGDATAIGNGGTCWTKNKRE